MWFRLLPVLILAVSPALAADTPKSAAVDTPYRPLTWTNNTNRSVQHDITAEQAAVMKGGEPVVVQLGRNDAPYRFWAPLRTKEAFQVTVPPNSKVELWSRAELAKHPNHQYAQAARHGALPIVVLGPYAEEAGKTADAPRTEIAPWRTGPASFRSYPMGKIPVTVRITNDGTSNWSKPRARLFVPENWKVEPVVADIKTVEGKSLSKGVLKRKQTGIASFTVTAPKGTILGLESPVFAFVRFNLGKNSVTVRNSVDAVMQEPIVRRYAMDEKGSRFIVRLINPFAPAKLGTPTVEVRRPSGTEWTVEAPKPVEVQKDISAIAPVNRIGSTPGQVAVPVVVTLNDFRMGYTPVVQAAWRSGARRSESGGLVRIGESQDGPAGSPDGLLPETVGNSRVMAFTVPARFAVSDPNEFVSPTWVTVKAVLKGANRVRLEYDAYDTKRPSIAGDYEVLSSDEPQTLSFLLADAAFQKRLEAGADLRLVFDGGEAYVREVKVSKWNPEAR
ncbi:MAG TPA: hypothetical protein PKK84_01940 [Armatimonadota bacterium]|nr:hypothetical protein [Armatimonadota bacterium]